METRVLIVGSGLAGLAAALHAAGCGLAPTVVHHGPPGGRFARAAEVTGIPGISGAAASGAELLERARKQAEAAGAVVVDATVQAVELEARPFVAKTGGPTLHAEALVLAADGTPRKLGLASEALLCGYGVSYCATCDGFFDKDRDVVVVGGGDTALDDAVYLAGLASRVTVVHRGPLRAQAARQRAARAHARIAWAPGHVVEEIHGEPGKVGVTGVTVRALATGDRRRIDCRGVYVAIGFEPPALLGGRAAPPGVFLAGDALPGDPGQPATAIGSGCAAAAAAARFLGAQRA